ncbi:zinc-ribbon domain-containing protein [Arenibacter sp. BSSL-BM3]|uniref:Zinc-ribbon domain-containing protein n=1 Tax=Arenibacter arenosicollis TaxID=2762274 RepID=A0ABR7QJK2_9FLAO|nr:zinc-ribbon domain-containing protein [Arenibacter arenosicollis]MBC8767115.1 zinc-ribbon domain-containing protein [Arenibacter arenosicollis]
MILFLGTKPGKTISKSLTNVVCPFCENKGTLAAVTSTTYFHLFWISLFRVGTSTIISCSHCKRTYFKDEFTEEMQHSIEN